MADRYWLGNYAGAVKDWHTSNNWAATSGGARLASGGVPTSADNVYFDGVSGNFDCDTTTAAYCNNITTTSGYTKILSINNSLDIYGSLSFHANVTIKGNGLYGAFNFKATTTGHTITTGGNNLIYVNFNGVGGEWTLGDALTCGSTFAGIRVYNGSFITNGYAVTALDFYAMSGTKSITLGTSTVTITGTAVDFETNSSGLTLSIASATFVLSGASGSFLFGSGNTIAALTATSLTGTMNLSLGTVTNDFQAGPSAAGQWFAALCLRSNLTVSGKFYTVNTATDYDATRLWIYSSEKGTQRTFSIATFGTGGVPSRNIDWEDIAVTGAASPLASGTHHGDCGGNSGIQPRTADTFIGQWSGGGHALFSNKNMWYKNPTGSSGYFPLPQDTVRFIFGTTGSDFDIDIPRIGNLRVESSPETIYWTGTNDLRIYGEVYVSGGTLSWTSTGVLDFRTNGNKTFVFNGITLSQQVNIQVNPTSSQWAIATPFTTTGAVYHTVGAIYIDNTTFKCASFYSNYSTTRSVDGNGSVTMELTGTGNAFNVYTGTGLTWDGTTITLYFSDTSATGKTIHLGSQTYKEIILGNGGGTGGYHVYGPGPTITTLTVNKSVACTITLEDFFTSFTFGTITGNGSAGNLITLRNSGTLGGTQVAISPLTGSTPCILYYWNFTGIHAGWNGFFADTPRQFDIWYGTDGGNNSSNIRFFPRDVYKRALSLLGVGT